MSAAPPDDAIALIHPAVRGAASAVPDLANLPRFVDRRAGAEIVKRFCFPVSPRSLEVWPLVWRRVNGKAVTATADLLALAEAKLEAAPAIRGGKRAGVEVA